MSLSHPAVIDGALLALLWLMYFMLHSALAALAVKRFVARRLPGVMPGYRLGYNLLAVLLLSPPLWLLYHGESVSVWQWHGAALWAAHALGGLAALGFVASFRYYDGREFLGLRRARESGVESGMRAQTRQCLVISPLHRYTRHPWYSMILLFVWSRPMDSLMLVTAALVTGYLIVGAMLEERKLVVYYGETYQRYRAMVPGLVPRPWRCLTPADADALRRQQQTKQDC